MSKSVILSLLAQGNTGTEILTILDSIVESIVQENIDSCAEVFAVWCRLLVRVLRLFVAPLIRDSSYSWAQCFMGLRLWGRRAYNIFGSLLTYRGDKSTSSYRYIKKIPGVQWHLRNQKRILHLVMETKEKQRVNVDPQHRRMHRTRERKNKPYWNFFRVVLAGWMIRYPRPFFVTLGIVLVTIYNAVTK